MAPSVAATSGITAAGVVVCFIIIACLFILFRRYMVKRNTRVTSSLDSRYGNSRITNPVHGAFSTYREARPPTLTPSECVSLIKVPAPIRTSTLRDKYTPPDYDVYYGPQSQKTHEEIARDLGFTMRSPSLVPSQVGEHTHSINTDGSIRSQDSATTDFSFESPQSAAMGSKGTPTQQSAIRTASSSNSSTQITGSPSNPGLPSHPKHNSTSTTKSNYRNFSRRHVRDLSVSRGAVAPGPEAAAKAGLISGPIVTVGTRYEEEEKARLGEESGKSYLDVLADRQKELLGKRDSVSSRKSLW